jgi:TonB family protein
VQAGHTKMTRALFPALFVLSVCVSMLAQESQLGDSARRMADSLSQSKRKSVAVFAFVGTAETEALGEKLADDFREALVKSGRTFRVEERSHLLEILAKRSASSASLDDPGSASWFLQDSEVDTSILGTVSKDDTGLRVSVRELRVRDAQQIAEFETLLPFTDDLKQLLDRPAHREFRNWPTAGKDGYSSPTCISCPQPQYFGPAIGRRVEGTVVLDISVGEDGRVRHIRIKKAAPYGMTEQAIAAVQLWRFKPATDPGGSASAVRESVTLNFRLY